MLKNIVIPVDLAEKTSIEAVLAPAINFVSAFDSKIHLVHILPDFGLRLIEDYLPRNWFNDQKQKCKKQLDEIVKKYVPENIDVEYYIGKGPVYDQVINYCNEIEADLIIMAAVRDQHKDYMLGPNASKIVRHSAVSVLVIRD